MEANVEKKTRVLCPFCKNEMDPRVSHNPLSPKRRRPTSYRPCSWCGRYSMHKGDGSK